MVAALLAGRSPNEPFTSPPPWRMLNWENVEPGGVVLALNGQRAWTRKSAITEMIKNVLAAAIVAAGLLFVSSKLEAAFVPFGVSGSFDTHSNSGCFGAKSNPKPTHDRCPYRTARMVPAAQERQARLSMFA
jgi:hypothetical protein